MCRRSCRYDKAFKKLVRLKTGPFIWMRFGPGIIETENILKQSAERLFVHKRDELTGSRKNYIKSSSILSNHQYDWINKVIESLKFKCVLQAAYTEETMHAYNILVGKFMQETT